MNLRDAPYDPAPRARNRTFLNTFFAISRDALEHTAPPADNRSKSSTAQQFRRRASKTE
ncbi:hypothetical protein A2U01_0063810, partial [Trifolium medium]|nr:hypothetical protein [Trifolium medium]